MLNSPPRTTQYTSAAACRLFAAGSQSVALTARERPPASPDVLAGRQISPNVRRIRDCRQCRIGRDGLPERCRQCAISHAESHGARGLYVIDSEYNKQRAKRPLPVGTGAAAHGSPAPTHEPQVVMKVHQNGRVEVTGSGTATDVAPSPSCPVCRQKSCVCHLIC
jgi:hypothetical protein